MCGRELPLVLLALVLCRTPGGQTAPAPAGGGPALTKMYPRGNHWAVGHLMGKKSTAESLFVEERGNRKQQLREPVKWEEAAWSFLGLLEGKGTRSSQPPPRKPPSRHQPTWMSENSNSFKNIGSKHKVGGLLAPGIQREGSHPYLSR